MITKKQDVIYNFFNWPHVAHSRLIVIAIANAMDLPEREFSGKIISRLGEAFAISLLLALPLISIFSPIGSNTIVFQPYSKQNLKEILAARMEGFVKEVFADSALEFVARKVASVLPDARRALDVARSV